MCETVKRLKAQAGGFHSRDIYIGTTVRLAGSQCLLTGNLPSTDYFGHVPLSANSTAEKGHKKGGKEERGHSSVEGEYAPGLKSRYTITRLIIHFRYYFPIRMVPNLSLHPFYTPAPPFRHPAKK